MAKLKYRASGRLDLNSVSYAHHGFGDFTELLPNLPLGSWSHNNYRFN